MDFNQDIADEICERLIGGESLRSICGTERAQHLPGQTTIFAWLNTNADFAKQYAHARELQAEGKFEETWDIAAQATAETVQVARLQVDTLKWQAGKLAPKKFGDKLAIDADVTHRTHEEALDALK